MRGKAGKAAAAILVAGWAATLAISWPGHLSYDSVVQLHDGRTGFYHSWHPPIMAWLLGIGDAVLPGTGLFVLFDATLLSGAMLALLWTRRRPSWMGTAVVAVLVLLPQFLLYQAIVWKDVLFADAAVAGFAFLAQVEVHWSARRARFTWIAAAFLSFALAALARQNGAIALGVGVAALGAIAGRAQGARLGAVYAAAALAFSAVLAFSAGYLLSLRSDAGEGPVAQLEVLRLYDLIGAVKADPSLPLDTLKDDAPDLERLIRSDGVRLYTPERNDTLAGSAKLEQELADTEPATIAAQWSDLVIRHPWLYLKVRALVFGWVLFTPDIAACRPVFTGVEGPAGEMEDLGIAPRRDARDLVLATYAGSFEGTPVFSHAFYGVVALAAMIVLLRRRSGADLAIAFMLAAALAFAASFFAISIACDYRYLYFLDLAALMAVFYLALDPAYLFQVLAIWSRSPWVARSDARKS